MNVYYGARLSTTQRLDVRKGEMEISGEHGKDMHVYHGPHNDAAAWDTSQCLPLLHDGVMHVRRLHGNHVYS